MLPNNKINGILNILNAINSAVLPEAQEYLCKLVAFLATKSTIIYILNNLRINKNGNYLLKWTVIIIQNLNI